MENSTISQHDERVLQVWQLASEPSKLCPMAVLCHQAVPGAGFRFGYLCGNFQTGVGLKQRLHMHVATTDGVFEHVWHLS
jgi:hypothetical protein